jgi:phage gpG-like protein
MAIRLTGDFARIGRKIAQLEKPQEGLRRVAEAMADETLTLINEGFAEEADPYGEKWAPLVLRTGKILQNTGGMAASWHRKSASSRGFRVANGKKYAKWHQGGTGIYGPFKHPIVPKTKKALAFSFIAGVRTVGKGGKALKRPQLIRGEMVVRSVKGSPRRRMVPDPGPVPTKWRIRLHHAARDALKAHFG